MSTGIFLMMMGLCTVIFGVAGIEGTLELWKGFLICIAGLSTMWISIVYMARYEPENLLDGDNNEDI
tara:strand:- start:64 stop:264 length:201 start_codon:yes stop_codon:yes gene_type:complete